MNGVNAKPSEPKRFTMPSEEAGPRCQWCDAVLADVYRVSHKDRFTFRERLCPTCGRKNTTLEKSVEVVD